MSFASALNILHQALPYHLALAKYDLIHITRDAFRVPSPLCRSSHCSGTGRSLFLDGGKFLL